MKIKTIDVNCLEWFDKVNGNSYFAGSVTLNYGMKNETIINLPFQYGYGDHYKYKAFKALIDSGYIKDAEKYSNGSMEVLWQYCKRKNIILRASIKENCKKAQLKSF